VGKVNDGSDMQAREQQRCNGLQYLKNLISQYARVPRQQSRKNNPYINLFYYNIINLYGLIVMITYCILGIRSPLYFKRIDGSYGIVDLNGQEE